MTSTKGTTYAAPGITQGVDHRDPVSYHVNDTIALAVGSGTWYEGTVTKVTAKTVTVSYVKGSGKQYVATVNPRTANAPGPSHGRPEKLVLVHAAEPLTERKLTKAESKAMIEQRAAARKASPATKAAIAKVDKAVKAFDTTAAKVDAGIARHAKGEPTPTNTTAAKRAARSPQAKAKATAKATPAAEVGKHPLYLQAMAVRAANSNKHVEGVKVTDEQLADHMRKAHKARPTTTMHQERRIATFIDGLTVARQRWVAVWSATIGA